MINALQLYKDYQTQDAEMAQRGEQRGLQNQLMRFNLMKAEEDRRRENDRRNALSRLASGGMNANALMGIDPKLGIQMNALNQRERLARDRMAQQQQQRAQELQQRQQAASKPVWDSSRGVWVAQPGAGATGQPTGVQPTMGGGVVRPEGLPKSKTEMKEEGDAKKEKLRIDNSMNKADIVIGNIDKAFDQISPFTTGLIGDIRSTMLGRVTGSGAYDLEKTLDTVKANIGFKELEDMRAASPTGGALGQVAVQELLYLQAALSSLDKGQSQGQLRENLMKVRTHFNNWKKTVQQSREGGQAGGVGIDPSAIEAELARRQKQ
jgi:hypothetical protein